MPVSNTNIDDLISADKAKETTAPAKTIVSAPTDNIDDIINADKSGVKIVPHGTIAPVKPTTQNALDNSNNDYHSELKQSSKELDNYLLQGYIQPEVKQTTDVTPAGVVQVDQPVSTPATIAAARTTIKKEVDANSQYLAKDIESTIRQIPTEAKNLFESAGLKPEDIAKKILSTDGDTDLLKGYYSARMLMMKNDIEKQRADINASYPYPDYMLSKANQEHDKKLSELNNVVFNHASQKVVNEKIKHGTNPAYIDPYEVGADIDKVMGDEAAVAKDQELWRNYGTINSEAKVRRELAGYQALSFVQNAALGNGDDVLARQLADKTNNYSKKVLDNNPEYVKKQKAKAISQSLYENTNPIRKSIVGYDVSLEDIQKTADYLGIKDIQGITPQDIYQQPGILTKAVGSFISNIIPGLDFISNRVTNALNEQRANQSDGKETQQSLEEKDQTHDMFGNWWNNSVIGKQLGATNPDFAGVFQPNQKVNTDPNSGNYLMDVKSPTAGNFSTDIGAYSNAVADGFGMMGAMGIGGEELGALANAGEKLSHVAQSRVGLSTYMYLTGFDKNYDKAKEAIGANPADEAKRLLLANIYTGVEAASAQFIPAGKVLDKFIGAPSMQELAQKVIKEGVTALDKKTVSTSINAALKETGLEMSKAILMGTTGTIGNSLADMALAPDKYAKSNVPDELKQSIVSSAITFMVPSLIGSVKRARTEGPMYKKAIQEVGYNPEQYINEVKRQQSLSLINEQQATERINSITGIADIVNKRTPQESPVNDEPLTQAQKADYSSNLIQEKILENQKAQSKDPVQEEHIDAEIQSLRDERNHMLETAGEAKPEHQIIVRDLIDKPVVYKGQKGTLTTEGNQYIVKIDGSNREYQLEGTGEEIGNSSIKDFDLQQIPEHPESVVHFGEDGAIKVRGRDYENLYSDPRQAISLNKDGNRVVTLDRGNGKKSTFHGDVAEELAYNITLQEISKSNKEHDFEQFINSDEPTRAAIENARHEATAEEPATTDNGPLPGAESAVGEEDQGNAQAPEEVAHVEPPAGEKPKRKTIPKVEQGDIFSSQQKTTQNGNSKENGQEANAQEKSNGEEVRNAQEGLLGNNTAPEATPPAPVKTKYAWDQGEEEPVVETVKLNEEPLNTPQNATTKSAEQEQEGNKPAGEQEHTGTGEPRNQETPDETNSGDSGSDRARQKQQEAIQKRIDRGEAKRKAQKETTSEYKARQKNPFEKKRDAVLTRDPETFEEGVLQDFLREVKFSKKEYASYFNGKSELKIAERRLANDGIGFDQYVIDRNETLGINDKNQAEHIEELKDLINSHPNQKSAIERLEFLQNADKVPEEFGVVELDKDGNPIGYSTETLANIHAIEDWSKAQLPDNYWNDDYIPGTVREQDHAIADEIDFTDLNKEQQDGVIDYADQFIDEKGNFDWIKMMKDIQSGGEDFLKLADEPRKFVEALINDLVPFSDNHEQSASLREFEQKVKDKNNEKGQHLPEEGISPAAEERAGQGDTADNKPLPEQDAGANPENDGGKGAAAGIEPGEELNPTEKAIQEKKDIYDKANATYEEEASKLREKLENGKPVKDVDIQEVGALRSARRVAELEFKKAEGKRISDLIGKQKNNIADDIVLSGIPGLSGKLIKSAIDIVAKAVRFGENLHLAIWKGIDYLNQQKLLSAKENERKELSDTEKEHIFNQMLGAVSNDRQLSDTPTLQPNNERVANSVINAIRRGEETVYGAIDDLRKAPFSDATKDAIANYIIYHTDTDFDRPENIQDGKILQNFIPSSSDQIAQYDSGKTLEKQTGEFPQNDQAYYVTKIDENLIEDANKMLQLFKYQYGEDIASYGPELLKQLKAYVDDGLRHTKEIGVNALAKEISKELVLHPGRRKELQSLKQNTEAYLQKLAHSSSLKLNTRRLMTDVISENISNGEEAILGSKVKAEADAIRDAINNVEIPDKTAEAWESSDTKPDAIENAAPEKAPEKPKTKNERRSMDEYRVEAKKKLKDLGGDVKEKLEQIKENIKKAKC